MSYVERKSELKRRRTRRAKIKKLRARMARAKNPTEADALLQKIKKISPFWQPLKPAAASTPAPVKKK